MGAVNQRLLQRGQKIRVMVVDDSAVTRRLIKRALEQDPLIEVVGTAPNGAIGLTQIPELNPDILTLDIEMPDMDGLEMLRHLPRGYPRVRVIMLSTLTERGAAITLEALTLGADDYVTKVSNEVSFARSMDRLQEELIPKIRQFFQLPEESEPVIGPAPEARPVSTFQWTGSPALTGTQTKPKALLIGVSTGGPVALGAVLPKLPADFPLPVLVVQHMPPLFTRLLAERLNAVSPLTVEEASQGSVVEPGKVLIAPGDFHMMAVSGEGCVRVNLDQSPQQNFCRPAVDALFVSAAKVYGGAVLAVILTGMGQDGLVGAGVLKGRGATILAQDEATSVVWGMPGAVVRGALPIACCRSIGLDLKSYKFWGKHKRGPHGKPNTQHDNLPREL
jgi:two-component system chemotaxis response regulator CheB